jgi:hypothetical protein
MDTIEQQGGPAFPSATHHGNEHVFWFGMSLRDWFAGQALGGITHALVNGIRPTDVTHMVADAYGIADAMLAERAKP